MSFDKAEFLCDPDESFPRGGRTGRLTAWRKTDSDAQGRNSSPQAFTWRREDGVEVGTTLILGWGRNLSKVSGDVEDAAGNCLPTIDGVGLEVPDPDTVRENQSCTNELCST